MRQVTRRVRSLIDRVRIRSVGRNRAVAIGPESSSQADGGDASTIDYWWMDEAAPAEGGARFTGWTYAFEALHPLGQRAFLVNGAPADAVRFTAERADLRPLFVSHATELPWSFECVARPIDPLYPEGVLELRRNNPRTRPQDRGRDVWAVPDPGLHVRLPEPERRFRVLGNDDPLGFLITGATDYRRLDMASRHFSGKPIHHHARVLDWGSGCGRVARHFPETHATALTGCDIDHDNVRWCRENLPGNFVQSTLRPPLPFADGSFDLVYGISVFTHLREPLQRQWLAELQRVTAPGGFLLMTVHGSAAIEFMHLSQEQFNDVTYRVQEAGIVETAGNHQIDGFAEHEGEYVNVLHSRAYVRRVWGAFFDILDILPGYLFTHDLVVMRRH